MKCHLRYVKRPDGWWITGAPEGFPDHGPYETKSDEAEEDKHGLERTFEHWDEDKQEWRTFRDRNKL